ncbi:MFS transporter [uncultured Ramlibacter sp.]|uniref:MFS transporter n=1 Tax=uncultured Ramlibacter sp. TaxID=260755 RepID=UPI002635FDA8|nr:MFS transporter [uncultured Ramlibacter sp.]
MQTPSSAAAPATADGYLFGRGPAWFAFAMSLALMVVDYVDRQIVVSLFPFIKREWGLSDTQLGSLVSVVSLTVGLGSLPVALFADRVSRVKCIAAMAALWSLATISCMWTRNFTQLLAARALVGVGEAGYGSVGAAVIASHFPVRMRGALLAGFFAAASVGSVLGVMLGGAIAARWGWQAAFGVLGLPGLVLALVYLKVRDYPTVQLTPVLDRATRSPGEVALHIVRALARSPTMLWVCIGGAAQLVVVSAVWSWLPSFLNRVHGLAPERAAVVAALVVLGGAAGSVLWGAVVDRAGKRRPARKLHAMAVLCLLSLALLVAAFGVHSWLPAAPSWLQLALVAAGGFVMTCTVGPVSAVVIDVVHPGVRATGASVLALFQNLFGLALGPVVAGLLSDAFGLEAALTAVPLFSLPAALAMVLAARTYQDDAERASAPPQAPVNPAAQPATAP